MSRTGGSSARQRSRLTRVGAALHGAWVRTIRWFEIAETKHLYVSIGIGLAFGLYFVLRYGTYWAEQDSQFFVFAIIRMIDSGHLVYNEAYSHGFAYPTWATSLALVTGLDVGELTRAYLPILGNLLLAVVGFAVFRLLLRSDRGGAAAVLVMFLVPELYFTVSRGNHEKFTIILLLFSVLVVLAGFRAMSRAGAWSTFAAWSIVFYLLVFGLIATNFIFGSGALFAWTIVFVALRLISWAPRLAPTTRERLRRTAWRLGLMCGTAWILAFLVVWHVYPPAQLGADLYAVVVEKVTGWSAPGFEGLGSEPEEVPVDPYAAIGRDWVSTEVYNLLASFRIVLLLGATITWLTALVAIVRRPGKHHLGTFLMVGMYGAYAMELALAVLIDVLGASGQAGNIQVRLYSYFAVFSAPLFALGALAAIDRAGRWLPRAVVRTALTAAIAFFVTASLLKGTLDPVVSNNWIFYHPTEVEAMRTMALHEERNSMWIGPEYRLWFAWVMTYPGGLPRENFADANDYNPLSRLGVHSAIKERYAVANRFALNDILTEHRVYDNGRAQVFRRIARTPFQE